MKYITLIDIPGIPKGTESSCLNDEYIEFSNPFQGTKLTIREGYVKHRPELFAPAHEKEFTIEDMRECWHNGKAGFSSFETYIKLRNKLQHEC